MNKYKVTIENLETKQSLIYESNEELPKDFMDKYPLPADFDRIQSLSIEYSKPKTIWDLKEGDEYWYIANAETTHDIHNDTYVEPTEGGGFGFKDAEHRTHARRIDRGNAFLTEQEAEQELERRKAIQRIKKWKFENDCDDDVSNNDFYKDDFAKYYIYVDFTYENGEFSVEETFEYKVYSPFGYFYDPHNAEKCIKECEEDLKIVFGV